MRNQAFLCLLIWLSSGISCSKDESNPEIVKGKLSINIGVFINISEEENRLKSTSGAEDFLVTIYNLQGHAIEVYEHASEIPAEIDLEPGQYYVAASSDNDLPAAFDNPYYYGESPVFSIIPGEQQTVSVNCELANTMLSIVYSEQVKSSFTDFSATVSTSAGSLVYGKDETRSGYFRPLPITISVSLTWQKGDGTFGSKTLTGNIADPKPHKKYEIHIDAGAVTGTSSIQIILDDTAVPIEIVSISDSPATGYLQPGDILITEIMYNPDALSDTEGEWFEIYNNTGYPVDLFQLVIRNEDNQHIIDSSIILDSHAYFILARTKTALAGDKYVYGSSVSLKNDTYALIALYSYGTDGTDGTVICSVDFGTSGFPDATGASLSLSPSLLNYTDALSGSSWCISSVTQFNTGDFGTPGFENEACIK